MLQVLEPQGQDLGFELIGLRAAIDQLELRFARLTAQFARTPYAAEDGGVSALEWIRFNCHMRSALEPLARPSGAHDERRREQRLADALVELASGGRPASLQVTATIETLKGLAGAGAAEMEFALPLSSISVQRLACECSVTRVLLSQESLVVDVGRSRRVVSPALQKALRIRDGHC